MEGEADPGLGGERLPQGRVPLPGLHLRRPRRQRGARPEQPDDLAGWRRLGRRRLLRTGRHLHLPDRAGLRRERREPRRTSRQATPEVDRVPDHAEHARRPVAGGDRDRDRRRRRRHPPVPVRGERERARRLLPHGPRRNRRADERGHGRSCRGSRPLAPERLDRHGPPADHRRSAAQRLGTRHLDGPASRRGRAVERSVRHLPAPRRRGERHAARRRGRRPQSAGLLRRRLPLQRPGAGADDAEPGQRGQPRLLARVRAGAGARRG